MKKRITFSQSFNKQDRRVLIENTKKAYKQYILEVEGGFGYLEKCKKDVNLPVYLVGIIQKGDAPNRNGRIYPFTILKKECERYMREEIKDGQSYGELDHPDQSQVPELKNAAMTMEDIWFKGTEVWGRVKLLNAFMPDNCYGKLARGIVLNGKTLGISSRALGSVYTDANGYDVVEEDLEIICWDLVSKPSTFDANLRLAENKIIGKRSGVLTEQTCFGKNCNIKTSKQIIKESKIKQLTDEERVYLQCLGVEKFLQIKTNTK